MGTCRVAGHGDLALGIDPRRVVELGHDVPAGPQRHLGTVPELLDGQRPELPAPLDLGDQTRGLPVDQAQQEIREQDDLAGERRVVEIDWPWLDGFCPAAVPPRAPRSSGSGGRGSVSDDRRGRRSAVESRCYATARTLAPGGRSGDDGGTTNGKGSIR